MAVRLTSEGLQSYDPSQVAKTVFRPRRTSSGGGVSSRRMSIDDEKRIAAEKAAAEKAAAEKIKAEQEAKIKAEQARQAAEQLKKQRSEQFLRNLNKESPLNKFSQSRNNDLNDNIYTTSAVDRTGQIYDPRIGMYTQPAYGSGAGGTAIITPPTPDEAIKIKEANIKGNTIISTATQYATGGVLTLNKEFNEDLAKEGASGSVIDRATKFWSPSYQYRVAEYNERLKDDIKEAEQAIKKVENAQKNLDSGKITPEQYNAVVNYYNNNKSIERLRENRLNSIQAISNSDLSQSKKNALVGTIKGVETLQYFSPLGRIGMGTEMVKTGSESYLRAITKTEKIVSGGSALLGGALVFSGVSPFISSSSAASGITGSSTQLKVLKGVTIGSEVALAGSIGAAEYFSTLQETGDKSMALTAGLVSGGTLLGGLAATSALAKPSKYFKEVKAEGEITAAFEVKDTAKSRKGYEEKLRRKGLGDNKDFINLNPYDSQYLKIKQKTKGGTIISEDIPTGVWEGKFTENRKLMFRNKEFTGDIKYVEGEGYIKDISYGKDFFGRDIRKITVVNEAGIGQSRLFKNDKLIAKQDVADTGFIKMKSNEIEVDFGKQEKKIGNFRESKKTIIKQDGDTILNYNSNINEGASILKKEGSGKMIISENKKTGTTSRLETSSEIRDVLSTSPKEEIISIKDKQTSILREKKNTPKIEYGEGYITIPKDTTLYQEGNGIKLLRKEKSPNIYRYIERKQSAKYSFGYKEPARPKPVQDIGLQLSTKITSPKVSEGSSGSGGGNKLLSKTKTKDIVYVEPPTTLLEDIKIEAPKTDFTTSLKNKFMNTFTPLIPSVSASSVSTKIEEVSPTIINRQTQVEYEITSPKYGNNVTIDYIQDKSSKTKKEVVNVLSTSAMSSGTRQKPDQAIIQIQKPIQKQKSKLEQIQKSKNKTMQINELDLRKITQQLSEQRRPEFKEKTTLKPFKPTSSLPKRLLERVEKQPEVFEAIGFRFGKEVKLGSGTKKAASKKLERFLTGTLGASGYLKTGEVKLKATETGLLKSEAFTTSKKDPFKVVEKKSKRLRKGTTGKEVQFFRGKAKKSKLSIL